MKPWLRLEKFRMPRGVRRNPRHPLYETWMNMRRRCSKPYHKDYRWYGARGIRVCQRWEVFENFVADMGKRPAGTTLDRINCNGDYEPTNCRWATKAQQQVNMRSIRMIEFDGRTMHMAAWARSLGIHSATLLYRIRKHGVAAAIGDLPPAELSAAASAEQQPGRGE